MAYNLSQRGGSGGSGRGEHSLPFHPRNDDNSSRDGSSKGAAGETRSGDSVIFTQGVESISPLDSKVKKIEDDTAIRIKQAGTKLHRARMPLRPGYGTMGKDRLLLANYFQLLTQNQDFPLYRYEIEIKIEGAGRVPVGKKAKRIIQLLLEEHLQLYTTQIATEFKANLISGKQVEIWRDGYSITYKAEDEDDPASNARQFRLFLLPAGSCSISQLKGYLNSFQPELMLSSKGEIIQALNIIVGYHPKNSPFVMHVGANKVFDRNPASEDVTSIGAGLRAIRGIFKSVRPATARLLVNIQVKNTAFYNEGSLEQIMRDFNKDTKLYSTMKLDRFLRNLSVDAIHISQTNRSGGRICRIKNIQGLANEADGRTLSNPPKVPKLGAGSKQVHFFLNEGMESDLKSLKLSGNTKKGEKALAAGPGSSPQGRYISVYDFFQQRYGINIKNPEMPVVNVGSRQNPSYLPAEVCEVIPGQPARANLSPEQTAEMIKFAVRKPPLNARTIVEHGARLLSFPTNPTLETFGIRVFPKLITVPGRVLASPTVVYASKKTITPRFGSWNLQDVRLLTSTGPLRWAFLRISVSEQQNIQNDQDFRKLNEGPFSSALKKLGLKDPECMGLLSVRVATQDLESQIGKAFQRFNANPEKRPMLVIAIIPEKQKTSAYNCVKFICDIKQGFLNVCVLDTKLAKTVAENDQQYFANIGLKINLKLGGKNHALDPSKLGIIKDKKTMVIGLDVTHPSPGSSSQAPSVVGMVASVDESLAQWPGELRIQTPRQEMVDDLVILTESRLRYWEKLNGNLAENLILCRDGVSEGQYADVLEKELPAIRKACAQVYPPAMTKANLPRITIIIVTKRHHTRFYPTKRNEADQRSWNAVNGTVVDRGVTEARNWDFYLQAHTALQGTAKPAHYSVIYDEIFQTQKLQAPFKNAADTGEDLMHNMCYLYGRATKAVSICPPVYYADLLCTRARCYLSSLYDPEGGSSQGGRVSGDGGGGLPDPALVRFHANVRDRMLYI